MEEKIVSDELQELIDRVRGRLRKEAKDRVALVLLADKNPKLAQLIEDIDQVISGWAMDCIRKHYPEM